MRYNICRDDNKGEIMMQTNKDSSMIAELYRMYEQRMFFEARGILSDDQLAGMLNVARTTINKYRKELNIPSSRKRKIYH